MDTPAHSFIRAVCVAVRRPAGYIAKKLKAAVRSISMPENDTFATKDCPKCGKPMIMQIGDRGGKGPTVPVCVPCTKATMAKAFPGLLP